MNYEDKLSERFDKYANIFADHPIRWIFGAVFLLGAIGFGISLISGVFSTAATVASAPGRVINKTLETNNIIQSYEWFYDTNAAFDARVGQINEFQSLYNTEEDKAEKSRLRIDLSAMKQTCRDLATKYNANSEKMNKSIFKGWALPEVLNISTCG